MRMLRLVCYLILPAGIIYLGSLSSCQNLNKEDLIGTPCDTTNVSYSADIEPLLQARCFFCHYDGSTVAPFSLQGYDNVKTRVNTGQLSSAVNHTGSIKMPKNGPKLPECDLAKINIWIENDAPNN